MAPFMRRDPIAAAESHSAEMNRAVLAGADGRAALRLSPDHNMDIVGTRIILGKRDNSTCDALRS